MSETASLLARFTVIMADKLTENSHRQGWHSKDVPFHLARLREEVRELARAIKASADPMDVARECADVANFAFFIADIVGALNEDKHRKRLNELLADTSDTMTDWEIDWITHLDRWVADLNADQAKRLERVWTKVFG